MMVSQNKNNLYDIIILLVNPVRAQDSCYRSPLEPGVVADVSHVYISIQLFNLSSLHLIQLAA